jgi:hypothetical protein
MATGQIVLMTGLCLAAFVAVAFELRWRARIDHRPIPGERGRDSRYGCYSPQRTVLLQMGLQQTEAIRRDLSGLLP